MSQDELRNQLISNDKNQDYPHGHKSIRLHRSSDFPHDIKMKQIEFGTIASGVDRWCMIIDTQVDSSYVYVIVHSASKTVFETVSKESIFYSTFNTIFDRILETGK